MTELIFHVFGIIIVAVLAFAVCQRIHVLRVSPIARLAFIPFWFATCFFFVGQYDTSASILSSIMEGYLFFQLVNLANTSRRTQKLLLKLYPEKYQKADGSHNDTRVKSLTSAGFIIVEDDKVYIKHNLKFLTMQIVSRFIVAISIVKY